MRHELTLKVPYYTEDSEGHYKRKDATVRFTLPSWDDINNLLGYMVEGSEGRTLDFSVKTIKEEA